MKSLQLTVLSAVFVTLICASFNEAHAAKYLQPGEFKELFKLEKIPLQVDSMKELSKHLTVLAQRKQDDSAINRRATGQLLALAMRLDPANQDARDANRSMLRDVAYKNSAEDAVLKAKARIRFFQRWLSNPQAGDDAIVLSKCLTDATKVLKQETINNADQANWSDVIPPLARYQGNKKNNSMPETDPSERTEKPEDSSDSPPAPKSDPKEAAGNGYQITSLKLTMPLAIETSTKYRDPKNNFQEKTKYTTSYALTPVEIDIKARGGNKEGEEGNNHNLNVKITSPLGRGNDDSKGLKKAIKSLEQSQIASQRATINLKFNKSAYSYRNGASAIAAVQLMLQASQENKPLRDDVYLCASLNDDGKLCLPPNFWSVLTALRTETTKRGLLIVPKTAEAPLTQLLVFGEPDFFTRWEVYTCETIEQALAVAAKTTDQKITDAGKLYAPVQKLSGKNDVTKLAVNRAVRKRLSDIMALTPNHLSAKVLLLQGSGKRPMRLNDIGLAFHLRPLIKEMSNVLLNKTNPDHPSSSALLQLHINARARLDPMERLVNRGDENLYQDTLQLANDLRSLNLLIKRNARDQNNSDNRIKGMVISLQKAITTLEAKMDATVKAASGN